LIHDTHPLPVNTHFDELREMPLSDLPGHGVVVGVHAYHAVFAHLGVQHPVGVKGLSRQWQQVRALLLESVDRPLARNAVHAHVGRLVQPYLTLTHQVAKVGEIAPSPRALLHIVDGTFHCSLLVRRSWPAGMDLEAVAACEVLTGDWGGTLFSRCFWHTIIPLSTARPCQVCSATGNDV